MDNNCGTVPEELCFPLLQPGESCRALVRVFLLLLCCSKLVSLQDVHIFLKCCCFFVSAPAGFLRG